MLAKFRSIRRGSVLFLFMMATPIVVIPLVGLGIDATMLRIVQARLGAAVDGAALGTGRLLGSTASPTAMATEFVKANFLTDGTAGFWGATNLQVSPSYTPGITKTIKVDASAQVPLLFARIFGQPTATVTASSTATRTDSRIMLVVDRSGSMTNPSGSGDGNSAITDAINKAKQFTQSFTSGTDEVGLIVFDGSATVAYPAYTPQGTYTTTIGTTGGPDTGFMTPMLTDLTNTGSQNGSTNTSEALWLAYVELQKAHMRDIQGGTKDTRLNAIVLLTDGIPQGVTIWPNRTNNASSNCPGTGCPVYFLASGTSCNNRWTTGNHNPTPMTADISVSASWGSTGYNIFNSAPAGLYQLATTDTTKTLNFWIGYNNSTPQPLTGTIAGGCVYLTSAGTFNNSTSNDLTQIPTVDAYGNTMNGNAYQNSAFLYVNGTAVPRSSNPIWDGISTHQLNVANVGGTNSGNSWVQAAWNATDSAAQRIRTDVNMASRGEATKMPIFIYCIGYLHPEGSNNAGIDSGLLARIANDQYQSSSYDSSSPAGQFILATDAAAMSQAFDTIRAALLRLAK